MGIVSWFNLTEELVLATADSCGCWTKLMVNAHSSSRRRQRNYHPYSGYCYHGLSSSSYWRLLHVSSEMSVKTDVLCRSSCGTLKNPTTEWPSVPSIGQNLQLFNGNGNGPI